MPPLVDLSKEDIIERLTKTIQRQADEIAGLRLSMQHTDRKIQHGCTDANCRECDGWLSQQEKLLKLAAKCARR